jgi:hypothetical protein
MFFGIMDNQSWTGDELHAVIRVQSVRMTSLRSLITA